MSKNNVHTETCHQSNHTLWNREWFTVRWGVSPCHGKFFAFEVLNTAEFVDDVEHICHTLCRMVDVALKVYEGRSLLENSIFVSFGYCIHKFFLVCMAFTDVHVIADTDYISHEGYHVCCFANSFAVCDLGFFLIEILHFQTKKVACRSERETCTCGVVTENGDSETAFEYFCGDVVFSHETESVSNGEDCFQFVVCFVPGPEEVVVVHFFEVEFVELVDVIL